MAAGAPVLPESQALGGRPIAVPPARLPRKVTPLCLRPTSSPCSCWRASLRVPRSCGGFRPASDELERQEGDGGPCALAREAATPLLSVRPGGAPRARLACRARHRPPPRRKPRRREPMGFTRPMQHERGRPYRRRAHELQAAVRRCGGRIRTREEHTSPMVNLCTWHEGCSEPVHAKGLCRRHHKRQWRQENSDHYHAWKRAYARECRTRSRYEAHGLCADCAKRAAWGHAGDFANVRPPCQACAPKVSTFAVAQVNGWRSLLAASIPE